MSSTSGIGIRRELLTVRFTPRQIEMLERLAEEQEITVSSLVRRALGMYVFNHDGVMFTESGPVMRDQSRRRQACVAR